MILVPRPSSPRAFKRAKVQKKKDKKEALSQEKEQVVAKPKTTLKLSTEEIEKALDDEEVVDSSDGVKPVEARTFNVQQDKDLCLKRLSSSWTNLNESKKDFNSSKSASSSQVKSESERHSEGNKQNAATNRKKKISDYFQSVPKS